MSYIAISSSRTQQRCDAALARIDRQIDSLRETAAEKQTIAYTNYVKQHNRSWWRRIFPSMTKNEFIRSVKDWDNGNTWAESEDEAYYLMKHSNQLESLRILAKQNRDGVVYLSISDAALLEKYDD